MEFDFSEDLLEEAKEAAIEMAEKGEKSRELKLGEFGRVFLTSDESLVKWIKAFKSQGTWFYIGAEN